MFNSSVSFQGTNTLGQRIPPYVNGLGFDADRIVADGYLANGATSAAFAALHDARPVPDPGAHLHHRPQLAATVVTKSVTDLNGGDVEPGDVLRYAVTTRKTATTPRSGSGRDAVPARTTFVPGSLSGPGGAAAGEAVSLRRRHARARRAATAVLRCLCGRGRA